MFFASKQLTSDPLDTASCSHKYVQGRFATAPTHPTTYTARRGGLNPTPMALVFLVLVSVFFFFCCSPRALGGGDGLPLKRLSSGCSMSASYMSLLPSLLFCFLPLMCNNCSLVGPFGVVRLFVSFLVSAVRACAYVVRGGPCVGGCMCLRYPCLLSC